MNNQETMHADQTESRMSLDVDPEALKDKINTMYSEVALNPTGDFHFEMGWDLAEKLGYPTSKLSSIPKESIESFAGVGYFFDLVKLDQGEKVLDLGSGSGMDTFYAVDEVGKSGKVVGVDINQDQLKKSKELKSKFDLEKIEFIKSDITDLPFDDNSFDAVISNGVFNLIPNKSKLFDEIFRVLQSGGRLAFSDIVSDDQLPDNIKCNSTLWASCIGGAEQRDNYVKMLEKAGFTVSKTNHQENYSFISDQALNASDKWGVKSYSFLCVKR